MIDVEPSLRTPPETIAWQIIRRQGLPVSGIVPMRDGREHHLFRLSMEWSGSFVLKFPRADRPPDPRCPGRTARHALEAEAEALRWARGVPAARPYRILGGEPPSAIMAHLPGTPPELTHERSGLRRDQLEAVCREMGAMLARIHEVNPPSGRSDIPLLPDADRGRAVLLHLDYHLGNVLGQAKLREEWKLTGVLDWTRCAWGPPEEDFTELGVSVFATNPWALESFYVAYRQAGGTPTPLDRIQKGIANALRVRMPEAEAQSPGIADAWRQRIAEWAPRT